MLNFKKVLIAITAIGLILFCGTQRAHATTLSPNCGWNANSNDSRGSFNAANTTGCTVTFTPGRYTNAPICVASRQSTINGDLSVAIPTATTLAINWSNTTTTPRNFYYQCKSTDKYRGTNVVGMEMGWNHAVNSSNFDPAVGPIQDTHYPRIDNRLIDYYASKNASIIRLLFSWEGMQSTLGGLIPASNSGNYKIYYDNFERIVTYATNTKGLRVIIEPWQADANGGAGGAVYRGEYVNYGNPITVTTAHFADFWGKMAGKFAGNSRVWFGLVNEPHNQSTMSWWNAAQAAVTAIRGAGAVTQTILVPGNGYSQASSWTSNAYDTAATKVSNADGWLSANGGTPLYDPMGDTMAEVHTYLNTDESGSSTEITAYTAARTQLANTVNAARSQGYQVFLGEIGFKKSVTLAPQAWTDFLSYLDDNSDTLVGYTWWAGGQPGWWPDTGATDANGNACPGYPYASSCGGHYSITPTMAPAIGPYSGDTENMIMIGSF
jgi:endoglucanase